MFCTAPMATNSNRFFHSASVCGRLRHRLRWESSSQRAPHLHWDVCFAQPPPLPSSLQTKRYTLAHKDAIIRWFTGTVHALFIIFYLGGLCNMDPRERKRAKRQKSLESQVVHHPVPQQKYQQPATPTTARDGGVYYPQDASVGLNDALDNRPYDQTRGTPYARDSAYDEGPLKSETRP